MDKRTILFCVGAKRAQERARELGGEYVSMMMHPMDINKLLKRFKDNKLGPLVMDKSMFTGWSINEKVNEPITVEFDDDFKMAYGELSAERLQAEHRVKRLDLRVDLTGFDPIPQKVGELDDGGE